MLTHSSLYAMIETFPLAKIETVIGVTGTVYNHPLLESHQKS
ncbi:MAG: hypothetical protein ACQZ3M_05530 [cyanobacterium endosymbiont of Rhopalodia fuxianensis]